MAKKKIKTYPYDTAKHLDDEAKIEAYMDEAFKINDPAFIADALGVVARACGMSKVAKKAGLSRESLYKALSRKGNPEFATILNVLEALGLRLLVTTVEAD